MYRNNKGMKIKELLLGTLLCIFFVACGGGNDSETSGIAPEYTYTPTVPGTTFNVPSASPATSPEDTPPPTVPETSNHNTQTLTSA